MSAKEIIFDKLEDFIKKFYTNEFLRGTLFFVGLGLLYFLFTSFVEYFLWLKPTGRTILFWLFVSVELFLLGRYILFPLFKLFKIQKGIDYNEASKIIGSHFSTVNDKLVNFLQLVNDKNQSELLLASIDQKANALQPIPFSNAIDFAQNKKYIPLAIIPVLILLYLMLSGKDKFITESMHRVVNYKEQFLPPAPFSFLVTNSLQTEQNKDFTLFIKTVGNLVPEKAMIVMNDESYFMESVGVGEFKYTFEKPMSNIDFHVEANEISSKEFTLKVATVPAIENFEMWMHFPKYLGKKPEIIKGTGNALVPEGTQITWKITAVATNSVQLQEENSTSTFLNDGKTFKFSKTLFQNSEYQILTSNKAVKNYEKLNYAINIVKDQEPTIKVEEAPDSLKTKTPFLLGQISDDYGFSRLSIVYFPKNNVKQAKRGTIGFKQGVYDKFVFAFPSNLSIIPGVAYEYYFEVFDNDALHGFKSAKSSIFSHRESTDAEKQEEFLEQQNNNINSLSESLKAQEKQQSELEKLQNTNKEKKDLDYKEQQKMNDFIKRQKQQEEMMKNFTEKIKENLDKFNPKENDPKKEELEKRLENVDKDLEKNKKLLDELKELNEKLQQEELFEKIEKFQQKSKNQTKSLEQLVELTKRFYVEKKAEQIADKLNKLAEKQAALSESKDNEEQKQNEINKDFESLQKELDDLQKKNKELKSPLDLPKDKEKEQSIDKDLKSASQELKNKNMSKATPKQKSAAQKMQQMAQSIDMNMQGGEKEQMNEDIKMLRQITDNLLEFSFSQEKLMGNFKAIKGTSSSFPKYIKMQQDLKYQFKHVDDSLFALSLRNPKIGEKVTQEIGNVYYHIDKGIDYFTANQLSRGTASQQYTFTSANNLANLLSDILNGMQMSMSGMGQGKPKPGQGQGSGMQLPDIIKKQEELGKKMGQGKSGKEGQSPQNGESGSQPGSQPGSKPGSGQGSGQGKNGKSGNDGEGDAQNVLDILKQQQQLRDALEKELERNGLSGQGKNILDQMKQIEKQLINKGFSQQLVQKALNLKYELLKLEKAAQEQNQDNKRQSNTNTKDYNNTAPALPQKLQEYLNSIEILNRQTLPLRSQFNKRVQEYFKENDTL
ncbi:MAG: DUF4175 family protein [Flavobacterium sp.]|nr:DUF4175 family protein [Flavobacterium sp.]